MDRRRRGYSRRTVLYRPDTSEVLHGPMLNASKWEPVLIAPGGGGKVYAIARRPFVTPPLNFEPWFEVLDLNRGKRRLCWRELWSPPFFPCYIRPLDYLDPPALAVASYAAVGSHILLSLREDKAAYAFDVDTKRWDQADGKNLPFDGQAVLIGDEKSNLFVSHSKAKGTAAVYRMKNVSSSSSSWPAQNNFSIEELSVLELPMVDPGRQLFCAIEDGSFCSFSSLCYRRSSSRTPIKIMEHAEILQRSFDMEINAGAVEDDGDAGAISVSASEVYTGRLARPVPTLFI